ncbi:LuxR C-terminal-related transcriptional regulator [Aldersonia sp. NBC_00410]|uniref:helix-turn-helix transcriptional regulator n=1 Tax=Aldersonia sp. NBC_00410 TaxID=2975954 RepID=UPI00225AA3AF|nr:LuxR family transcriptional regulator [Aldersonia sp. NBC_00410]MCX5041980.1 LuxR C-terminal-related transcriptional regulator [Aldersonia sp. NBC_00410]
MALSWPLVERRTEFDVIRTALSTRADRCGVILTGDAGVGKTTLARNATRSLGSTVRWVAGTESARSIPLGVFAHLVSSSTSRDPVTFMSAARESLLSGEHSVIGVDDAHLLDQLSATLLHQLAIDRAVRIVATVRSGESVPDAVTSLWKDGHLIRLDLAPFSKKQSIGFVEKVLGGKLEGLSADLMWESSGGNALFLHHLVEAALESGALRQVRGIWQLRGRTEITSELAALLESRVDQLPNEILQVLKLLTFCEPLDLDVLCELAGEEAVEDAETRGLVKIVPQGGSLNVQFTHPLFGEVIRRRLGLASSRRLRGQLVGALRTRPLETASDRIRLAELALESDQQADAELFAMAAEDATLLADHPLGERLSRAAIERGGGLEAAEVLARTLLWQGQPDEAERILAEFDPDSLDQVQLVRWGLARVANLFWSKGDAERADQVLAMVRARVTHPALAEVVAGLGSACAAFENRLDDALSEAQAVLANEEALPNAVEWASFGAMWSLALMGRCTEVAPIAERFHRHEQQADGLLRFTAARGEILSLTFCGDLGTARAHAERGLEFSSTGQYLAWAMANFLLATVDLASGRCLDAATRIEQALAATASDAAATWSYPARTELVQAYAALGRSEDAARNLAEAQQRFGPHLAVTASQLELAEAWLRAAEGSVARGIEIARAAGDSAAGAHQFAVEADALHTAARFGDRTVAERLGELAAQLSGRLIGVHARHAAAVAADNGAELDAAAAEYEQIGALLSSADASAQAASAHERAGNKRATAEAAAAANRNAAECGGAMTPALRVSAQPLPLTAREREIANLVAAGLTNKQIAERIFVSVRTVEGHLYRACAKLDVTDRDALAALTKSGETKAPGWAG